MPTQSPFLVTFLVALFAVLTILAMTTPRLVAAVPGDPIPTIPTVVCDDQNSITLTVRRTRINVDNLFAFDTRLYFYNGVPYFPAPTIVMTPGTQCSLTLVNDLLLSASVPAGLNCTYHLDKYHCPDTTNLHTHGLHVDPAVDRISVAIPPTQEHVYNYQLLPQHLMGTFFYHAHWHGSVTLQVAGGLAGALLMNPGPNFQLPPDFAALYDDSATLIFLQDVRPSNYVNISGGFEATSGQSFDPDFTFNPSSPVQFNDEFLIVNGVYQPAATISPNKASLFRFINAGDLRIVELEIVGASNWGCTMQLVARDGIFQPLPYLNVSAVVLLQAGRSDVAILCTNVTFGQTLTVRANPSPSRDFILGPALRVNQSVVFTINVVPGLGTKGLATSDLRPMFPDYLNASIATEEVPKSRRGRYVLNDDVSPMTINNVPFGGFSHGAPLNKFYMNYVHEYSVSPNNDNDIVHPFHLHVYSTLVVRVSGNIRAASPAAEEVIRVNEWRDTEPALPLADTTPIELDQSGLVFRFRPMHFGGTIVLHCHILHHEDEGMMGFANATYEIPPAQIETTSSAASLSVALFAVMTSFVVSVGLV